MATTRKPTHPGEVLRADVLEPLGLTLTEAARRLGVGRTTLSSVVNGKTAVTPDMAVRIGRATRTTPESWLHMQAKLDLWQAEQSLTPVEMFADIETV